MEEKKRRNNMNLIKESTTIYICKPPKAVKPRFKPMQKRRGKVSTAL